MSLNNLWVEKYRPSTLDGYVLKTQQQKAKIQNWIDKKEIPNLLFWGPPGTGKTTLAKILINECEVEKHDVLEINASRENGVDTIREKITGFVQTMPFGEFKVVLLDEADYITPAGQAILRGMIEEYHRSARFILTCNYSHKIIPALHSRFQGFKIEKSDEMEFLTRMVDILDMEKVHFELEDLQQYINATYPDLRKCIGSCQENVLNSKLQALDSDISNTDDIKEKVQALIQKGSYTQARKLLSQNYRPDDMHELIQWCYNNVELWGDTDEKVDNAILKIRDAAANHTLITDPEINVSALLIELSQIAKSE